MKTMTGWAGSLSSLALVAMHYGLFSSSTAHAQSPPVVVRVSEGVKYLPKDSAGNSGVMRSLDITVTNTSKRHLDLTIEYALFAIDPKGAVNPLPMRYVKGKNNKVTVTLSPGESRAIRAEGWHPGELAQTINKAKDLGIAVDTYDYYDYYRKYYDYYYNYNRNYYDTPYGRVYTPARGAETEAPTQPASGKLGASIAKDTRVFLPPERYYGYSIGVYLGADLVALLDKNPANVKNFGVPYIK